MSDHEQFILVRDNGQPVEIFDQLEHAKSVGSRLAVLEQERDEDDYYQAVPPRWYQSDDEEWTLEADDGTTYYIYAR